MSDHAKTPLLRIGVPSKGRLAEISAHLLNDAGVSFRRNERSLFALCRGICLSQVEGELARRFGISGLDEKASRTAGGGHQASPPTTQRTDGATS